MGAFNDCHEGLGCCLVGWLLWQNHPQSCEIPPLRVDTRVPLTIISLPPSLLLIQQGSNATGDCCSKCWNDANKKAGASAAAAAPAPAVAVQQPSQPPAVSSPAPAPPAAAVAATSTSTPDVEMADVEPAAAAPVVESKPAAATSPPAKKKKSKKKKGYKNLLAGMMEGSGTRDAEQEKKSIEKVTGGGAFVKIDKI